MPDARRHNSDLHDGARVLHLIPCFREPTDPLGMFEGLTGKLFKPKLILGAGLMATRPSLPPIVTSRVTK
jgi:hypothetical protein